MAAKAIEASCMRVSETNARLLKGMEIRQKVEQKCIFNAFAILSCERLNSMVKVVFTVAVNIICMSFMLHVHIVSVWVWVKHNLQTIQYK